MKVTNILTLLLAVIWITNKGWKSILQSEHARFLVLAWGGYFLLQVIGCFYSEGLDTAFGGLEKKLVIIVFPILLANVKIDSQLLNNALRSFIIGVLLAGILVIAHFYIYTPEKGLFNVVHFSLRILKIDPIYFSSYVLAALVFLFYLRKNFQIPLLLLFFLLLGFYLFIFPSRMTLFLFFVMIVFYFIFQLLKSKKILIPIGIMVSFLVAFFIMYQQSYILKWKFDDLIGLDLNNLKINKKEMGEGDHGVDYRVIKWQSAINIIRENPILGVGTGDEKNELLMQYKNHNFVQGMEKTYNAHNEYLSEAIRHGIIGLLIFCLVLFLTIKISYKNQNYLFIAFMVIILCIFLIESYLSRQRGAVFFAFFSTLLFYYGVTNPPKKLSF
ncbi:O-antigen ligase family protein [Fulvivirgaceae bacterium BMA12]|uniref:O-antigen ligase family protein n=2 Tax=Agaribacillus aureus TaxID=3051825 RepID=A0ABT8LD13_9BACT|nr:O-antigen ligase family protein [Fulvivirgaceae bacterium BMA12]